MKTLPVGDFKAQFSEVIEQIKKGEEIAISYGKKKEKIAVLVPWSTYSKKNKRTLGLLADKASFTIKDGFSLSDEDFLQS